MILAALLALMDGKRSGFSEAGLQELPISWGVCRAGLGLRGLRV